MKPTWTAPAAHDGRGFDDFPLSILHAPDAPMEHGMPRTGSEESGAELRCRPDLRNLPRADYPLSAHRVGIRWLPGIGEDGLETLWLSLLDIIDEKEVRIVAYRLDAASAKRAMTAGTMVCSEKVVCYLM